MANPHLEVCPDYLAPDFEEAHLFFMIEGKTNEEAAAILRNIWLFSNAKAIETWDWQCKEELVTRQQQQEQAEQDAEQHHILCEEETEQAKLEE